MKKMRLFVCFSAAFLFLASATSFAQGRFGKDSAECVSFLNFYADYYKQGNMKEAAPLWVKAIRYCPPTASQNLLIHGRKIMEYRIKNHKGDAASKQALIDSLIMLSDIRAQVYPNYARSAKENKIFDMLQYKEGNAMAIFTEVEAVIKEAGVDVSDFVLVTAMTKAKDLYQAKKMTDAEVLAVFSELSPIMDEKLSKSPNDEDVKSAYMAFQNAFVTSGVANCDNLVAVFTPRFDATPNDLKLVKTIVNLLSNNDCLQTELFLKTVTAFHQLEPSYNSSFFLYRLHRNKENNEEALKYLQEAINSPESDAAKDAELMFEMATYYFTKMNNGAKAVSLARESAELSSVFAGKANFLIATVWGNQKCGGNEIEQRAKYWVAVDYLQKAKAADPLLAEEADKMIGQFRQYFPKTEDAFMYDIMDGKSFSVSCGGLSATTTVRTLK